MIISIPLRRCVLSAVLTSLAAGITLAHGQTNDPDPDTFADKPIPTVSGLAVLLQTKDGRQQLHFGEIVDVKLQYVALQSGRYVHVNLNSLKGGHPWQWQCEPREQVINRRKNDGRISAQSFYYAAEHCREGVGGGSGSGCGHCGEENPLGLVPLSYEVSLNNDLQFLQPGRYTCRVATADVATAATSADEERAAIELVSNPIVIDLNDDPSWSAATLAAARQQYSDAHCRDSADEGSRCWDPVNTIRFLDTEDSLTELVHLYKGIYKPSWQQFLWLGILQSQHPKLARRLLEERMADPDFTVTTGFLDTLTGMALRENHPEAFSDSLSPEEASTYHLPSLEILRNYLRTVAKALPKKRAAVLAESLETYTRYAGQSFCEDKPLIPAREIR